MTTNGLGNEDQEPGDHNQGDPDPGDQDQGDPEAADQETRAPAAKLRPKQNTTGTPMGRLYRVCTVLMWMTAAAVVLLVVLVGSFFADLNAYCVMRVCTARAIEQAFVGTGSIFTQLAAAFIIVRTARYVIGPRPWGHRRNQAGARDNGEGTGVCVGRKRVARLMRQARIQGVHRRRRVATTKANPERAIAPDLVRREFTADGPDRIWVADITYIPTRAGFLYLAAVIDAWSRQVWDGPCATTWRHRWSPTHS